MKIVERDFGLLTTKGVVVNGQRPQIVVPDMLQPVHMPMCPVRKGANVRCRANCAMHKDGGCVLATIPGSGDTSGMNCPLTNTACSKDCALYNEGCVLISIALAGRKE